MTASHGHARFPVRLLIVAVGMSLGIGSIVALPEPAHAAIDCAAAPDDLAALQAAIPSGGAAALGLGPGLPATLHTPQLAVPAGPALTPDLCGPQLHHASD